MRTALAIMFVCSCDSAFCAVALLDATVCAVALPSGKLAAVVSEERLYLVKL